MLAYSTVSALGLMMMLFGLGSEMAVTSALVYLIAHAGYKGALFLIAGTLEHETGTRDVEDLGGLRHAMPATAAAGLLAACSMAGVPMFVGFVGKELLYETLFRQGQTWSLVLLALTVAASVLLGVAGFIAGIAPFAGHLRASAPDARRCTGTCCAAVDPRRRGTDRRSLSSPRWMSPSAWRRAVCWGELRQYTLPSGTD